MDTSPKSIREYFAAAAPDEIGEKLYAKVQDYENNTVVSSYFDLLNKAWKCYFGFAPEGVHATSALGRGGDQGETTEIRINHARSLSGALLNLVVAQKLAWQPKAVNLDAEAVAAVDLARSTLEYYWQDKKVSQYATRAVEECLPQTEGFVFTPWDETLGEDIGVEPIPGTDQERIVKSGDIAFYNVASWDVIRDHNKKSWDELDWVTVRLWHNRFDLAAQYPLNAEEILLAPAYVEGAHRDSHGDAEHNSDDVPVYYFFHKDKPSLPGGRETVFLEGGKTVLKHSRLTYDRIPLHRVVPAELFGTPYGYSPFIEILGMQEAYDSISTDLLSNISTFGRQSIAMPQGSEIPVDQVAGGFNLFTFPQNFTSNPIQAINLVQCSPQQFQFRDGLRNEMELCFGINAVVRGQAPDKDMSGAALALLQSQALQQSSTLAANYVQMVQDIGNSVIQILRRKATAPRRIAISGRRTSYLLQLENREFSGKDFGRVEKVQVEVGNPLAQTPAGRSEIADKLIAMGLIRTAEQYHQMLLTGQFDPLTRNIQDELTNIISENEDIARGEKPVAMLQDDHVLHVKEHKVTVANPAARRNPAVLKAYMDHVHEHYSLYYNVPPEMVLMDPLYHDRMLFLMGIPPPPPMMIPPGAMAPQSVPGDLAAPQPEGALSQVMPMGENPATGAPPTQGPNMPNMPTNPATGSEWNPVDAGGAVPPAVP